jgi:hypothetical protein
LQAAGARGLATDRKAALHRCTVAASLLGADSALSLPCACLPAGPPSMSSTLWCPGASCYAFSPGVLSWNASLFSCISRGGSLVVYNSGAEQTMVESTIKSLGNALPADYWCARPALPWLIHSEIFCPFCAGKTCVHARCCAWLGM